MIMIMIMITMIILCIPCYSKTALHMKWILFKHAWEIKAIQGSLDMGPLLRWKDNTLTVGVISVRYISWGSQQVELLIEAYKACYGACLSSVKKLSMKKLWQSISDRISSKTKGAVHPTPSRVKSKWLLMIQKIRKACLLWTTTKTLPRIRKNVPVWPKVIELIADDDKDMQGFAVALAEKISQSSDSADVEESDDDDTASQVNDVNLDDSSTSRKDLHTTTTPQPQSTPSASVNVRKATTWASFERLHFKDKRDLLQDVPGWDFSIPASPALSVEEYKAVKRRIAEDFSQRRLAFAQRVIGHVNEYDLMCPVERNVK
eukprot:TRINITY_DN8276_c0_g3_i3.p1 TRINITY_DN8276_c0_g3~~TRINITY_DN8276_c0_g3_i3.p1  ORF type:complete len:318 (-),score=55.12 TRINITY_DN8276_c0_g3_i3:64-1017(-)